MPFLCLSEAYLITLLYHMFAALQKPKSVSCVGSETEPISCSNRKLAAVPGRAYLSFTRIYEHNLFLRWSLNCTSEL